MKKQSIAGIIVVDNLVFIGKRLPQGQMGNRWEFPGGKVEAGETHQEALLREFQEEFMIDIEVGECIAKADFKHNNDTVNLFAYEIKIKDIDNVSWILSEHTDVNWVSFDKISELEFVDSDLLLLTQIRNFYGL
ncbi:MAG: NUDIX domain-containing protein [Treponemataceae bacterium]|nr:NUDIX domain-containing protein [Treponemataceae bacterium]